MGDCFEIWNTDEDRVIASIPYEADGEKEPLDTEDGANARLIAAAPELLEALKQTVEWLERLGETGRNGKEYGYIADARAAIAKAERWG